MRMLSTENLYSYSSSPSDLEVHIIAKCNKAVTVANKLKLTDKVKLMVRNTSRSTLPGY